MRQRRPLRRLLRPSSGASVSPGFVRRRWSPRIAALLVLVMLIPVTSLAIGMGISAVSSWQMREAALRARADVEAPSALMAARTLMVNEAVPTVAVSRATELGADAKTLKAVSGVDFSAELVKARQRVDAAAALRRYPKLAADLKRLEELRPSFTTGKVDVKQIIAFFTDFAQDIDAVWIRQLEGLRNDVATSQKGSGTLVDRINVLPTAYAMLATATSRSAGLNAGLQQQVTPESVRSLIASDGAYRAYARVLAGHLGPQAYAAWAKMKADPQDAVFDKLVTQTIDAVLSGKRSPFASDLRGQAHIFVQGSQSFDRLQTVAMAAAVDVRTVASAQANAATRSFEISVAVFIVSLLLAAAAAVILVRFVVRPLHRLSRAARELAGGNFTTSSVPPTGPREVADTIAAVDELAAALAAVEGFTVTLAEDPDAASLDAPLPGRTGVALQTTLDRLRESVRESDRQRVELRKVAMHDQLTGLLNRRAALEAVQRELDRAERDPIPVMALFVDLDGLKTINDTYGHAAGDEAIRLTAEALRTSARKFDVVARLGGDEFLIAGGCIGTRDDLQVLAERIHEAIGNQTLNVDGDIVPLRCSVGVALSTPGDDVEKLISEADRALYAAKRTGRDRICWDTGMVPRPRAAEAPVDAG